LALFNLNDEFYSFAQAFRRLFSSLSTNYIEISRALMTFGDYSKSTAKSGKKLAYGNRTDDRWRNIFTPSRITDFAPTKKSVNSLLSAYLKESKSAKQIIEEYLITFESNTTKAKPFAYYYIKYSSFHFEKWQYGFYGYWKSIKKYEAYKMNKEQFNGRHWCPFSLELLNHNKKKLSLETDGIPLTLEIRGGKFKMECLSEGYSLKINKSQKAKDTIQYLLDEDLIIENEEIDYLFKIKQDEDGFDIEDRIEKGKELIDIISTLMK